MAISKRKMYAVDDGYELITEAQLRSAVKRINDRLFQLHKAGLSPMNFEHKGSEAWNEYANLANKFGGIQWHEGKAGTSRAGMIIPSISVKNIKDIATPTEKVVRRDFKTGKVLETKLVSSDTAKLLIHYDVDGGSSAKDRAKAKKWLEDSGYKNPTHWAIRNACIQLGTLHQFIEDHASSLYDVEKMTGEDIVHNNSGHLTVDEVARIMNIEEEKEQLEREKAKADKPEKATPRAEDEEFRPFAWM